jgi:hypothetical protein
VISNGAAQARQTAGARDERTLFAVACSRLLGPSAADAAVQREEPLSVTELPPSPS